MNQNIHYLFYKTIITAPDAPVIGMKPNEAIHKLTKVTVDNIFFEI